MKYEYKIIWIDDSPEEMSVHKYFMKSEVEKCNMKAIGLDKPFTSFGEFSSRIIEKLDETSFFDYDLILVDFNLSDEYGCNGIDLIKSLRDKGIYTDVLFYSGNMDGMRAKLRAEELDNVTYSDNERNRFLIKFKRILEKQMNLIMQISDLRGYLMDSTSDFDFTARNYVQSIFEKLEDEDKLTVVEKIRERISQQSTTEVAKFEGISRVSNPQTLVKKAMDAIEYVTTAKDKMYILGLIVQKYKKLPDTYAEEFEQAYYNEIINKRNKLAHSKLLYGTNQSGHIRIAKSIADLQCGDCEECTAKFVKSECEELRRNIQKYYVLFKELLEEIQ